MCIYMIVLFYYICIMFATYVGLCRQHTLFLVEIGHRPSSWIQETGRFSLTRLVVTFWSMPVLVALELPIALLVMGQSLMAPWPS